MHALCHGGVREVLVDHLLGDLASQHTLDGNGCRLLVGALFAKPIVEAVADVVLVHRSCLFIRLRTRSISCGGVF